MSSRLLLLILLLVTSLSTSSAPFNDGPYVFEAEDHRLVYWICDGNLKVKKIPLKVPTQLQQCGHKVTLWQQFPAKQTQLEFNGDFKVAAASDIHGQFELFYQLLRNNKIIDKKGNWSFDNGHFVITGDVFDRGPQVTEALWFLYNLEKQAKRAGGQLHLLLGNHEVMVLNADLRYLHEKYIQTSLLLDTPYADVMRKHSVLGDWLRSLPVLAKINGILYAHGGFHPDFVKDEVTLAQINQTFTESLVKKELGAERSGFADFLHRKEGVVWYRGYFYPHIEPAAATHSHLQGASASEIDALLRHFAVQHIVVGHTSQDIIETRFGGKVIAIDASMKNGLYGEILLIDQQKFVRGTLSGAKIELEMGRKLSVDTKK